jgi:hypothetical protein
VGTLRRTWLSQGVVVAGKKTGLALGWVVRRGREGFTGRREDGKVWGQRESSQVVLDDHRVEVDQQSDAQLSELQVGQELSLMDGQQPVDSLDFDHEGIVPGC